VFKDGRTFHVFTFFLEIGETLPHCQRERERERVRNMEVKSASASSDSSIRQPGELKSFFKRIRAKKGNQVRFFFLIFFRSVLFSSRRRRSNLIFKKKHSYASIVVRKIRNGPV